MLESLEGIKLERPLRLGFQASNNKDGVIPILCTFIQMALVSRQYIYIYIYKSKPLIFPQFSTSAFFFLNLIYFFLLNIYTLLSQTKYSSPISHP